MQAVEYLAKKGGESVGEYVKTPDKQFFNEMIADLVEYKNAIREENKLELMLGGVKQIVRANVKGGLTTNQILTLLMICED